MEFQSLRYLLSDRPHASELRASLKTAILSGARTYLGRFSRGQTGRTSEENRRKYDGLAGAYYSAAAIEVPKLCVLNGQLTRVEAVRVREVWVDKLAAQFRAHDATSAILEVGSGDGNNLPLLRKHFPDARLAGIDFSPKRVEFAQNNPLHAGLDLDFRVASATDLPFETGSFDAVYSMYCLEHLPHDFPQAIREMCRVARECVVLVEPVPEHRGIAQQIYAKMSDFVRGLPAFLESEGLNVESIELLDAATVPLNMGSLITIRIDRA
jgi:ubiquinone/menaquinone biosynthesis C-methylase UbiE